jgi:hypothetical protein
MRVEDAYRSQFAAAGKPGTRVPIGQNAPGQSAKSANEPEALPIHFSGIE